VKTSLGFLDLREHVAHGRKPLLDPAYLEARLGKKSEPMRLIDFTAGRTIGVEPRVQPGKPFLRLARFDERPTGRDHGNRDPVGQHLFGPEGDSSLGPLAAQRDFTAQLMKDRREGERKGLA
jgi:hypothetical protein